MKRMFVLAIAASFFAAACGSSSPSSPSPTQPTFTAALSPANENPPITGAEASGSGNATITFNTTKDAAGNITAASVTFVVNMQGFPAGTPINIAHIHTGAAGQNGGVLVSTTLAAGEVVLANGSGSFTKTVSVDPAVAQNIINNPAGFYFNIHSAANPGGVARGQLVKVQ
jgi:CHRD domain-containing protein